MEQGIRGYKVFEPDWTCRGKQYTCPGKFEEDIVASVCEKGMHFCKKAVGCFNYYPFKPENRVAEVIAYGAVAEKGDKCCTDKLEIVREIPWAELLELVNTGKGCTGFRNSGDRNSGDRNSGDRNSGDRNSGNFNSGYRNSGDRNSGNCNSGDWNSGSCNSGYRNSGDWNRGNHNSGDWNSGDWNRGNHNSGDWNRCDFSNGCFNTIEPKICLFNKPSEWTYADWLNGRARRLLNNMPGNTLKYIGYSDMTEDEKKLHPEAEITGGYLRTVSDSVRNRKVNAWWKHLSDSDKEVIMAIPNFDADIFREITGIDVNAKEENETDS